MGSNVKTQGDVLEAAGQWRAAGHQVALATVLETWGSAPRQAGSQLAVNDAGEFVGSVSGGCVESAVIDQARAIMVSGEPAIFDFGVSDDRAWEVGLACGGRVQVFIERLGESNT